MAKKKGECENTDNDLMMRAGHKELYRENKTKKIKIEKLKDTDTKKATMDFIFSGNSNVCNPLVEV